MAAVDLESNQRSEGAESLARRAGDEGRRELERGERAEVGQQELDALVGDEALVELELDEMRQLWCGALDHVRGVEVGRTLGGA